MGNVCARLETIAPPSHGTVLSHEEVRMLLRTALRVTDDKLFIGDGEYFAYDCATLQQFLSSDRTNALKYRSEKFDCDDFARVLVGQERVWFRMNDQGNRGSTLGIVWGDIRPSETSTEVYAHAVNVFIDSNREVWLVEPQNDQLSKPTSNSTFWMVCI